MHLSLLLCKLKKCIKRQAHGCVRNKLLQPNECVSSVSVAISIKVDQKVNLTNFKKKTNLKSKYISLLPYTQIVLFQIDNADCV